MIDHRAEGDSCDPDCIAYRIDAACTLLTEDTELANAITLVGATNCGKTLAAVQRAQRACPVEIVLRTHAGRPEMVNIEIRRWPESELPPVGQLRAHVSMVNRARSLFAALRRPSRRLERSTR